MGEQVTLETLSTVNPLLWPVRWDGAQQHMLVLDAARAGYVTTPHGAPERYDWGVTAWSLAAAWDREMRADRLVQQMTPEERASLWAPDPAVDQREQALLRRAAVRMVPFAALTEQVRRMR